MRRLLAVFCAAALVFLSVPAGAAADTPFPDVAANNPYIKAIALLKELSVLGGDENGNFNPWKTITRAEFSKIIYVLYNGTPDAPKSSSGFPDVAGDSWYNGYVNWAAEKGIVGGRDTGLFDPNAPVTVAEATKMFVVAATGERALEFPAGFVSRAEGLGLYKGASVAGVNGAASRQLVAQIASNAVYTNSVLLSNKSPADRVFGIHAGVSLLEYSQYVKDGNWQPAIAKALSENDVLYVPAGIYKSSTITVPSGKTIYGDGDSTVFIPISDTLFSISGITGGEIALSEDKADFSGTFKVTSSQAFKPGDLIYMLGQRNYMLLEDAGEDWCLGRSYYDGRSCFFGEFLTVKSVSGNTITTTEGTIFPYYYADGSRESDPLTPKAGASTTPFRRNATTIKKVVPATDVLLRDFTIEANGGTAVYARWAKDCRFENLTLLTDPKVPAEENILFIHFRESLDCVAVGCSYTLRGGMKVQRSASITMDSYMAYKPYAVISSFRCGFIDCYADGGTQCFMFAKVHGGGPTVDCYVKDSVMKNSIWSGVYLSQGTYRSVVTGNTITDCATGISVAGRQALIEGNYIDVNLPFETKFVYVRPEEGGTAGVMVNEGYGIDSVIKNNTIKGAYSGVLVRDGYEDTNIFTHGSLTVEGNDISECKNGFFFWKNTYNTGFAEMDIIIKDNRITGVKSLSNYGIATGIKTVGLQAAQNTITDFPYALYVEDMASDILFSGNTVTNSSAAVMVKRGAVNAGRYIDITISGNIYKNVPSETAGDNRPHVRITKK